MSGTESDAPSSSRSSDLSATGTETNSLPDGTEPGQDGAQGDGDGSDQRRFLTDGEWPSVRGYDLTLLSVLITAVAIFVTTVGIIVTLLDMRKGGDG